MVMTVTMTAYTDVMAVEAMGTFLETRVTAIACPTSIVVITGTKVATTTAGVEAKDASIVTAVEDEDM